MSEEKFVSIEHDTWINKYKPMEERLKQVEAELESKAIRIYITAPYAGIYDGKRIGAVNITTPDENKEVLMKLLGAVNACVASSMWKNNIWGVEYPSYNELTAHIEEKKAVAEENNRRYSSMPGFLKKLFKIRDL